MSRLIADGFAVSFFLTEGFNYFVIEFSGKKWQTSILSFCRVIFRFFFSSHFKLYILRLRNVLK